MKLKGVLASSLLAIGLLTGCSEAMRVSADEIISNVLEAEKELKSYYAEAEMSFYEDDKLKESSLLKEYRSEDRKIRIVMIDKNTKAEAISVNDGQKMIAYDEKEKKAFIMDTASIDMPDLNHREQLLALLDNLKDSHDYEFIGEEKVNGFQTHHMKLKPKEKNSLFGEMEFWVDQKTWFLVKTVNIIGSNRSEMTYSKLDTSPKFTDDTFTLTLPDGVEITNLDNEIGELGNNIGTIEEAEEKLGAPFFVLNEEKLVQGDVEIDEMKGMLNRTEISITYKNVEELTQLYLTIFPTPDEKDLAISDTGLKVRGQNAEYMKEINTLMWDENGLRYVILVEAGDLSKDKIMEMAERMKLSSSM